MKPAVATKEDFLDTKAMELLLQQPRAYAAATLHARATSIERFTKRSYVALGLIFFVMEKHELFKELQDEHGENYKTFTRWALDAAPSSRSHGMEAKAVLERLQCAGAEIDRLMTAPRCNLVLLSQLSPAVIRKPEILEAACVSSEDEFREVIEKKHPEQHVLSLRTVTLKFDKDQYKAFTAALEMISLFEEGGNQAESVCRICEDYLDHNRTRYEHAIRNRGYANV